MGDTMTVTRAYRVALDPTREQEQALSRHARAAQWAYSHALAAKVAAHERWRQEVAWATYEHHVDETTARAMVKVDPNPDQAPSQERSTRSRATPAPASRGRARGGTNSPPMPFSPCSSTRTGRGTTHPHLAGHNGARHTQEDIAHSRHPSGIAGPPTR
ncbi:MAG: helix-turn-helix domain-containing protein, partial [Dermatophilaceae bacterium]